MDLTLGNSRLHIIVSAIPAHIPIFGPILIIIFVFALILIPIIIFLDERFPDNFKAAIEIKLFTLPEFAASAALDDEVARSGLPAFDRRKAMIAGF